MTLRVPDRDYNQLRYRSNFAPYKIVSSTTLNLGVQCYIFAQNYTNKPVNIKTIIFDLGGVIIDLDFMQTPMAFSRLTHWSSDEIMKYYWRPGLFQNYEKGLISDVQLRQGINELFSSNLSDNQIDEAWCAMLGDVPKARLELMRSLRNDFNVLVLSNTNTIHVDAFNKTIKASSGEDSLVAFADEIYFSHEMHMRKPDLEIYRTVLDRSGYSAEQCLFLDDTMDNLEAAGQLGIQTRHITHPDQIFRITTYV